MRVMHQAAQLRIDPQIQGIKYKINNISISSILSLIVLVQKLNFRIPFSFSTPQREALLGSKILLGQQIGTRIMFTMQVDIKEAIISRITNTTSNTRKIIVAILKREETARLNCSQTRFYLRKIQIIFDCKCLSKENNLGICLPSRREMPK